MRRLSLRTPEFGHTRNTTAPGLITTAEVSMKLSTILSRPLTLACIYMFTQQVAQAQASNFQVQAFSCGGGSAVITSINGFPGFNLGQEAVSVFNPANSNAKTGYFIPQIPPQRVAPIKRQLVRI